MTEMTQTKEKLAADFRLVMSDIDALMNATANKAEGEITALRSRIYDRLDSAKERVVAAEHDAVEGAKRAAAATDSFVNGHPWQAVGVAAAVGVALGVLIGRR